MKGYLLDENLPGRLTVQTRLPLLSSVELAGRMATDETLWEMARRKELVLVTKDADFSERMLISEPPPWIVHLRFGNLRRRDFYRVLEQLWPRVEALLPEHKLINVFRDRIEAVR